MPKMLSCFSAPSLKVEAFGARDRVKKELEGFNLSSESVCKDIESLISGLHCNSIRTVT